MEKKNIHSWLMLVSRVSLQNYHSQNNHCTTHIGNTLYVLDIPSGQYLAVMQSVASGSADSPDKQYRPAGHRLDANIASSDVVALSQ